MAITKRDVLVTDENGNTFIVPSQDGFWYTTTGNVIKWVIFLALLFAIIAFFVIGKMLALRRLKQNKAPAKWNRWMLNRRQRAEHEPRLRNVWPEHQVFVPAGYAMNNFQPAPAYSPNGSPPMYQPPLGASKVDPVQTTVRPVDGEERDQAPGYTPPPGPPPAARVEPERTGGTNPFR